MHDSLPVHICYHLCGILHVSLVTFEHVQVLLQSPPIVLGPEISPGGTLCRLKWRACLLCWQRASARVAAPRLAFRVTPRNASFLTACKLARLRAFLARDSEVVSNPAGLASVGGNDSRKSEQRRQGCAHVEVAAHRKRAALIFVWRWRRCSAGRTVYCERLPQCAVKCTHANAMHAKYNACKHCVAA